MLKAGSRNRRVELLRNDGQRNEANEQLDSWVVFGSPWASIRYVSGLATIKAGADLALVRASIRLPYRLDIVMGMRVRRGSNVYEVDAVLPDEERHRHVDLVCRLLAPREVGDEAGA